MPGIPLSLLSRGLQCHVQCHVLVKGIYMLHGDEAVLLHPEPTRGARQKSAFGCCPSKSGTSVRPHKVVPGVGSWHGASPSAAGPPCPSVVSREDGAATGGRRYEIRCE